LAPSQSDGFLKWIGAAIIADSGFKVVRIAAVGRRENEPG
jgi:hypothetical protein